MKDQAPVAKANPITFPKCWRGESFNISPSFWGCFCMFYWSSCFLMPLHPLTPHPSRDHCFYPFIGIGGLWGDSALWRVAFPVLASLPPGWLCWDEPRTVSCTDNLSPGGLESPLLPCEIWAVRVQGLPVCPIRSATERCFWQFPQFKAEDSQPWRQWFVLRIWI